MYDKTSDHLLTMYFFQDKNKQQQQNSKQSIPEYARRKEFIK